jgi:hypothetical protein
VEWHRFGGLVRQFTRRPPGGRRVFSGGREDDGAQEGSQGKEFSMYRWQRKGPIIGVVIAAVAIGLPAMAFADRTRSNDRTFQYAVGLWGDLPYSAVQADPGVPNLIADMNSQKLAFSVHDGDLKGGNGPSANPPSVTCDDALYTHALGYLNSLDAPAAFTPGDNDWTDCDRPSNGGFNSLERLDHERQVFFSTSSSFGRRRLRQEVQTDPTCLGYVSGPASGPTVTKSAPCVENRRWTVKGVTYATLNVQGSCNNLCDTAPNAEEYTARNAADIAWLHETFRKAKADHSAGVMLISQADPGFDQSDPTRSPLRDPKTLAETDANPDGYQSFLGAVRSETNAFAKPVVYVHGDSHYFRVDKPLLDAAGKRLENFTRVETFGDNAANGLNDVHWVKALVDPSSRDVFAFQPQIVPANTVPH